MHYPDYYTPKPYSKSFVLHLDSWYAQSHPDEDFAETFAVWLYPQSDWRDRYADWPAVKKLEYMDTLMRELAGKRAVVRTRRRVEPLSTCTRRCARTTSASAGTTASSIRTSTIATCASCSRTHPSMWAT